jgi:hypothetical protein
VEFRTGFPTEQSIEPIDEMVVPNMPEAKNIIVDDNVVDILGFYTPESTSDHNLISLDQPTLKFVPYDHHPIEDMEIMLSYIYIRDVKDKTVDQYRLLG